jgi:hypothetical protein
MNINNTLTSGYRFLAITFLSGIFAIASIYAILVAFYVVSSSWGSPIMLSPSQTKVLTLQPQIAALVHGIDKQKADLQTAALNKELILEQLISIDTLAIRLESTTLSEKARASSNTDKLSYLYNAKQKNIAESQDVLEAVVNLRNSTLLELKAGLITADEANQRLLNYQGSVNSITDSEVTVEQISIQAQQLRDYSDTLGGKNRSVQGLTVSKQLMELKSLKAQLKVQLDTVDRTMKLTKRNIAETYRILQVATDSPYYRALTEETLVIFIPYANIEHAKEGVPIYDCILQVIVCRKVGSIETIYSAEEYAKHPLFKTDLKGKFATITLSNRSAIEANVLFIGSKPLFI